MTAHTFADIHDNGYRVEPSECNADAVYLTFLNNNPARWIANEDAPAVALAILEAAGIDGRQSSHAHHAARALMDYEAVRKSEKERDAEDAKVVKFHTAIGANLDRIERHHRNLYNAARKFFEETR